MDPSTDSTVPALGEPAATTDTGPSLDQMIAEAEAAQPAVTEQPSTETPPSEAPAAPAEEAKPPAEEPKAEEKPEAKADDGISEKRARQILDAAHRKHAAAEKHTVTFVQNVKRELMADPSAALEKHFGISLDGLIDISTGVTPAERTEAKPETSARDAELDRRLTRIEQREQELLVSAKVAEIKGAVSADAKAFPTINAKGRQDVVIDFMTEYFNTHGSPIAWKEAAKLVEAELRELTGGSEPAVPAPVKTTPVVPPRPTTALTNGDVRTTAPVDEEPSDPDELIKFLTQKEEARLNRRAS